jgi:hypothetical protein
MTSVNARVFSLTGPGAGRGEQKAKEKVFDLNLF